MSAHEWITWMNRNRYCTFFAVEIAKVAAVLRLSSGVDTAGFKKIGK
jgi:hypothetical protein